MYGITVFHSLAEALHHGFHFYDVTPTGYLVRQQKSDGRFALALVDTKTK
jgi:hypothetical protein